MKLIILLSAVMALVASHHPLSNEFIDEINHKKSTWKAGRNFHAGTDLKVLKTMMGVHPDSHKFRLPEILHDVKGVKSLPEIFDARLNWPTCQSIRDIRDQGGCGSCWAVSSVSSMSDRVCIFSNGTDQSFLSSEYVLDCASRMGCNGGAMPSKAFDWWLKQGIVSGGAFASSTGCQPYQTAPCVELKMPCTLDIPRRMCQSKCTNPTYNVDFIADKHYASRIYSIARDETQIQLEILRNGPVSGFFTVFEDFLSYKSGVYQKLTGKFLGSHAVRVIGWGVEGDKKYWLVANSWSTQWGDQGLFKILRGQDHLGIESDITAGIPK